MTKILLGTTNLAVLQNLGIAQATEEGLETVAQTLEGVWKAILDLEGTGRVYTQELRTIRRGGRAFVAPVGPRTGLFRGFVRSSSDAHQASSPGDAPAPESGTLRDSIHIREIEKGSHYQVGTTVPYAIWLEFGVGRTSQAGYNHPAGISIAPRPHARPAGAIALPDMKQQFVATLRTAKPIVFETIDLLRLRQKLLGLSVIIGNLRALGIGSPMLSRLRSFGLGLERGIGDFSAFANGTLGLRLSRRVAGRSAGRWINNMTSGIPGRFSRRAANRSLSRIITTPALRRMFP